MSLVFLEGKMDWDQNLYYFIVCGLLFGQMDRKRLDKVTKRSGKIMCIHLPKMGLVCENSCGPCYISLRGPHFGGGFCSSGRHITCPIYTNQPLSQPSQWFSSGAVMDKVSQVAMGTSLGSRAWQHEHPLSEADTHYDSWVMNLPLSVTNSNPWCNTKS